jgi:hypothetical protein
LTPSRNFDTTFNIERMRPEDWEAVRSTIRRLPRCCFRLKKF